MQRTKEWVNIIFTVANVVLVAGLYVGKQESKVSTFGSEIVSVQAKLDNISTDITSIKVDVARLQERVYGR
jgi:outer membrane murein-binding lipoprotein Lpp